MIRRPTALAAALAATVTLALAPPPTSVRADALTSTAGYFYELTPTQDIPAITSDQLKSNGPQVIYQVPLGSIVPPVDPATNKAGDPLIIRATPFVASNGNTYTSDPGYSTASGAQNVIVSLLNGTDSKGNPAEFLGVSFLNGLTHDQQLVFSLNVPDPTHPPTLIAQTSDVSTAPPMTPLPPPKPPVDQPVPSVSVPSDSSGTGTTATNTPEPMSLALWSVLLGGGLLRARAFRRRA